MHEAAFARRKRRKAAGGNQKTEIPPGPPPNLYDQIARLHTGRLWLQRLA